MLRGVPPNCSLANQWCQEQKRLGNTALELKILFQKTLQKLAILNK